MVGWHLGMIRTATFIAITFVVAYSLYVFPFVALVALFAGHAILQPWSLVPALLILFLIRLYFSTSVTNKMLKAFV